MSCEHKEHGGCDQSQKKKKLKKFKKVESSPKLLPNNKNDERTCQSVRAFKLWVHYSLHSMFGKS